MVSRRCGSLQQEAGVLSPTSDKEMNPANNLSTLEAVLPQLSLQMRRQLDCSLVSPTGEDPTSCAQTSDSQK